MSALPGPDGLAAVLRQLVALGEGRELDENSVAAESWQREETEKTATDGGKFESNGGRSCISPWKSFTAPLAPSDFDSSQEE